MINILIVIFLIICLSEIVKLVKNKEVNSPLTKIIPENIFYYFYLITLVIIEIVLVVVLIFNLLK
ncbi:hypothetical protein [Miniphocaeibacter halophilus]|uniref:Uncharacterized protein n=1 Tax=Miniphocaeibacter halophilus TaxID=2931922 RepID=A0AC61MRE1_9FIRM|nr:hypothetical protein [Miniphocaeibacter halophilus]QQK08124.1 hypothetical protein JFY71_00895 [Miniphocaeibacter halophilus]